MKLCRFVKDGSNPHVGMFADETTLLDLTAQGVQDIGSLLELESLPDRLAAWASEQLPRVPLAAVSLRAPVDRQEVWAAGVTYLRSKTARMEESDFGATAYDRVYSAVRPELFFKSLGEKVAGPGEPIGIRRDAHWNVPEPELALVLNSRGQLVGVTVGNDMSSRAIEGENLLYLPQAKIYRNSCALGPCIRVGVGESEVREWKIEMLIGRAEATVFRGETSPGQLKRRFAELAEFLFRSQEFPHGAVLLTGTGIVPPAGFTLLERDVVEIQISGIGVLRNPVELV